MKEPRKPNPEYLEKLQHETIEKRKHSRRKITPPTLEDFERVCEATRGRVGKIAEAFEVSIHTVYKWRDEEPGFNDALNAPREIVMDKLQEVAELLAIGIPDIDPQTGRLLGWKEPPKEATLHKLLDTYGMMRGFGRNPQEVNINLKDGTIPVAKWLEFNTEKVNGDMGQDSDTSE